MGAFWNIQLALGYNKHLLLRDNEDFHAKRGQRLRKQMTAWEKLLWNRIRKKKLVFHWRCQHPVGGYVLDFYCDTIKLCVEVDGEGHRKFRDDKRDAALAELGILTLRFTNERVGADIDGCLEEIQAFSLQRLNSKT